MESLIKCCGSSVSTVTLYKYNPSITTKFLSYTELLFITTCFGPFGNLQVIQIKKKIFCGILATTKKKFILKENKKRCKNLKRKDISLQAYAGPVGSRSLQVPGILDSRHMMLARLSDLHNGRLLISLEISVDTNAIVRPERLLERVCSQTQLCQLRCFNNYTRQLDVSAPTGHFQVVFK